jgi:pyruvate,orthophosphate dikinase
MRQLIKTTEAELEPFGEKAVIGALLETPRACLTAGTIAQASRFVIVSVLKLTEFTFASTSADAEKTWLRPYRDRGIFKDDIFGKVDTASSGVLMTKAIKFAREAVATGEIAIYNEGFGDPGNDLIEQYIALGVNGLICKPSSVPIARLFAAKSFI